MHISRCISMTPKSMDCATRETFPSLQFRIRSFSLTGSIGIARASPLAKRRLPAAQQPKTTAENKQARYWQIVSVRAPTLSKSEGDCGNVTYHEKSRSLLGLTFSQGR